MIKISRLFISAIVANDKIAILAENDAARASTGFATIKRLHAKRDLYESAYIRELIDTLDSLGQCSAALKQIASNTVRRRAYFKQHAAALPEQAPKQYAQIPDAVYDDFLHLLLDVETAADRDAQQAAFKKLRAYTAGHPALERMTAKLAVYDFLDHKTLIK